MAKYHLEVTTGNQNFSGTFDQIFVTLIGSDGQSDKIQLNIFGIGCGSVSCTLHWTLFLSSKENNAECILTLISDLESRLQDKISFGEAADAQSDKRGQTPER